MCPLCLAEPQCRLALLVLVWLHHGTAQLGCEDVGPRRVRWEINSCKLKKKKELFKMKCQMKGSLQAAVAAQGFPSITESQCTMGCYRVRLKGMLQLEGMSLQKPPSTARVISAVSLHFENPAEICSYSNQFYISLYRQTAMAVVLWIQKLPDDLSASSWLIAAEIFWK